MNEDYQFGHELVPDMVVSPAVSVEKRIAGFMSRLETCRELFDVVVIAGNGGRRVRPELEKRGFDVIEIARWRHPARESGPGELKGRRCCFVDDFIALGYTLIYMRKMVEAAGGTFVGAGFYHPAPFLTDPISLLQDNEIEVMSGRHGSPDLEAIAQAELGLRLRPLFRGYKD